MIGRWITLLLMYATMAQAECRQALALGLDVSGSVDAREYRLQLDGLAAALTSGEVRAALLEPSLPPVRLSIYAWSGAESQRLIVDWIAITSDDTLMTIAQRLRATERQLTDTRTGLGPALLYGEALLNRAGECPIRTIDISGDGRSNHGLAPEQVTIAPDITVNGLAIGVDQPGIGDLRQMEVAEITAYYRTVLIRGPEAFIEVALGFEGFEEAMTRKLVRELQVMILGRRSGPGPLLIARQ